MTQIINHRHLPFKASRVALAEISETARNRLALVEKYRRLRRHGLKEAEALDLLDLKRSTFFTWQARLRAQGPRGLEPKSRRPHRTRKPRITAQTRRRVAELRRQFPLWGKLKIARLLQNEGCEISAGSVGRIISALIRRGAVQPAPAIIGAPARRRRRHWRRTAKKWRRGMKARRPGELIQIDHMSVTTQAGLKVKHFQATCPITKLTVAHIAHRATSRTARDFLRRLQREMPVPVRSLQADGGSEFMKHFETACEQDGVELYILPPRSPQKNGCVERRNGTFRYEFYQAYDTGQTWPELRRNLDEFTWIYNHKRPHQALDSKTPIQYHQTRLASAAGESSMS